MLSNENMRCCEIMRKITIFVLARGGNAGAEFALLLPLLAVLLFGGIEIGRVLHDYHVVSESVRDAGRYMSRVPATCAGWEDGPVYTALEHQDRAKRLALTGDPDPGAPYHLGYWTDPSTVVITLNCIAGTSGKYQGLYEGVDVPHVVVTATVPFSFLFGQLVTSSATIDLTFSHNVVVVGL